MLRQITGYIRDEHNDWIATLDCHHGQHVRHKPPFVDRPWVETATGRDSQLGQTLNCLRCDRLEFPDGLLAYKRTPDFNETTIPAGLLRNHSTKVGTWALIHVLEGSLRYTVQEPTVREIILIAGEQGVIAPAMSHNVAAEGKVRFFVEFHAPDKSAPDNPHIGNILNFPPE